MTSIPTRSEPYGPGKFNTTLDAAIYELTLDTSTLSGEFGDSSGGEWWGLILFDEPLSRIVSRAAHTGEWLTAAILTENSQGFVMVEYWTLHERACAEFDAREQEYVS